MREENIKTFSFSPRYAYIRSGYYSYILDQTALKTPDQMAYYASSAVAKDKTLFHLSFGMTRLLPERTDGSAHGKSVPREQQDRVSCHFFLEVPLLSF
ncbi:hypothetical protein IJ380_02670 [Candidatus Saccharibacteria bacterium]|nr:hypothetical protein [Candidatus Saccharibacteria bacterium]